MYVCQHEEVIAVNRALVPIIEQRVPISEMFEGGDRARNFFDEADFHCVAPTGQVVPLEAFIQVTTSEVDLVRIHEAARGMAVSVVGELAKNSIVHQIIERS